MKFTLITIAILVCSTFTFGQSIEVSLIGGYTFDASVDIRGGRAKIEDGFMGEINVGYGIAETYFIELSYLRQPTVVTARSVYFQDDLVSDAAVNYIYLGTTKRFIIAPKKFNVFGGLRAGASIVNSTENKFSTKTRFALGVHTGLNYYFADNLGIKAGANLHFPVVDAGANLWWGSGSGPQVGVSAWMPLIQFNPYAGLILRF